MNALDVLEFFESSSVADATRALKYASRIVADRTATAPKPAAHVENRRPPPSDPKKTASIRVLAEAILRDRMEPTETSEIVKEIRVRYQRSVSAETLTSILSRLVSKRDTFSRRAKGMYALLEWESDTGLPLDQDGNRAQNGA